MYSGWEGNEYSGQRTLPRQLMPRELWIGIDKFEGILRGQAV